MKLEMLVLVAGLIGGIATSALLVKRVTKWRKHMDDWRIDTEIRLGILEYNHAHELDCDYLRFPRE